MPKLPLPHVSTKLAVAAYALAGTETIQERLIKAWEETFQRLSKADIPPELVGHFEEIDSGFKLIRKQYEEEMPHCLLHMSDEEAIAIAETIILLALEFSKLLGIKSAQKY